MTSQGKFNLVKYRLLNVVKPELEKLGEPEIAALCDKAKNLSLQDKETFANVVAEVSVKMMLRYTETGNEAFRKPIMAIDVDALDLAVEIIELIEKY